MLKVKLSDESLMSELKVMRANERHVLIQILEYLREVESRKLHLARGYSSMFSFCMEFLGYSESEAHIRIQAMRLSREIPQAAEMLGQGKLSLTVAAMAQTEFRKENLRLREGGGKPMPLAQKREILLNLESMSKRQAQKKLVQHFPLGPDKVKMSFEATPELAEKIEVLKGMVAHKNFSGELARLVEIAVDIALVQLNKQKAGAARNKAGETAEVNAEPAMAKTENASTLGPDKVARAALRSRYISVKAKQEVWRRSGGQCAYIDKTSGKRCTSRHGLEVDHIHEFGMGGSNGIENLRLMCSSHNKFRSL